MARLSPLDFNALSPEQQTVVDAIRSGPRKGLRGPFEAWVRIPAFAAHAQEIGAYIRFGATIPADVREMAIIMTGKHWRAQFEFWAHARLAREAGLPGDVIEAIRVGAAPSLDRPDLVAAHRLVSEYLSTTRVSDETFKAALDIFGEAGVMDIIAAVGYYGMVSMTLNIFEVPLPEGEKAPLD